MPKRRKSSSRTGSGSASPFRPCPAARGDAEAAGIVCADDGTDVESADKVELLHSNWLEEHKSPKGALGWRPPVEPLAIAGGHMAARRVAGFCPDTDDAVLEHVAAFAGWMYRTHRKHRRQVHPVNTDLTTLRFGAEISRFAQAWIAGRLAPPRALERLRELRTELNEKDTVDGTDGDAFWETLVFADPVIVYRRFKPTDYKRLLAMGQSRRKHKGTYHSDCLAVTTAAVNNSFATAHARITVGAPVLAFPMMLFAGKLGRARECELALFDVDLTVTGASPVGLSKYTHDEATVELETIWGDGDVEHVF